MCSHKSTCFAAAFFILLLIPGTPSATSGTTATPASMENVKVYSAIAISVHIDIVCKKVTEITKDVWAINHQLSKLENSLSEIKNTVVFIKCGITALIHNTELPDIEFE